MTLVQVNLIRRKSLLRLQKPVPPASQHDQEMMDNNIFTGQRQPVSEQFVPGGNSGLHSLLQAPNTSSGMDDSFSPRRILDEPSIVTSVTQNVGGGNTLFGINEDLSRVEQMRSLAQ